MTLEGFATNNATKQYSEKHKDLKYNSLGKTDLFVSEVGFGGYRIDIRSPLNRDALKKALLSGINLIDTSSNYTDGNSEELVGDVITELVNAMKLTRESVVVVTKGGYIQGEALEISQERKDDGVPYPELVEFAQGLEHCIHPEFLAEHITMSLERLNLKTVDAYLLHNPEYFLKWAKNKKLDVESAREKYYDRIKKAFEYLETEVRKGRIKYYGISSNTFVNEAEDYEFTSLEKVLEIAKQVSAENHFRIVEFPLNIFETQAVSVKNQLGNKSVLELAKENNLGVLINRPLNAFKDEKLIRLAEPFIMQKPTADMINQEFKNIGEIEKKISEKLKTLTTKDIKDEIESSLFIYDELAGDWDKSGDTFEWKARLNQRLLPRFHYYKNFIKNNSLKNEEFEMDLFSCTFKTGKLFSTISVYYDNEYLKFTEELKGKIANASLELADCKKLSHIGIHALRMTKGISSILVGMTSVPYVMDVIAELKMPADKEFDITQLVL
jgi:aryl-alcohol dehydrogenase-like predicted oxidoreductase